MSGRKRVLTILGVLVALAVVIGVYLLVQNQAEQIATPSPTPRAVASPSPQAPGIFEVTGNACTLTFTVTGEPGLFCDEKLAFFDEAVNEEDSYTLTTEYTSGDLVAVGDVIVYMIGYTNSGTAAVDGTITDVLPVGLEFMDADTPCIYAVATRTISCDLGSVVAGRSSQRAYRARVLDSAVGTVLSNTASVTPAGESASTCSFNLEVPEGSASPSPSPSPSGSPTPTPSGSPTPTPSDSPAGSPTPTPSGSPPPSQLPEAGIMTFTTGTIGAGALLILLGLLGVLLF